MNRLPEKPQEGAICTWCDPRERNTGMFQECKNCAIIQSWLYAFMNTKRGMEFVEGTKERIAEDKEHYRKTHCFICDTKIDENEWMTHPQCRDCLEVTNGLDSFLTSAKGVKYVRDKLAGKVIDATPVDSSGSFVLDDDHNG